MGADIMHLESSAFSVVQEALSALRVVKAFGQEEREQERFVRHSSESFSSPRSGCMVGRGV